ncbi:MAG: MASE3 domain-containing protein [Desulfobacteraceae bacterium]
MKKEAFPSIHPAFYAVFALAFTLLYLLSVQNYLLYHSIAETFSIFVAFGVFAVSLETPRNSRSFSFFTIIGTGFLFTGSLDFLHMLTYKGMGVFSGHGADTATKLWIAARSLETLAFLAAILFLNRKVHRKIVWTVFLILFSGLAAAIFFSDLFPTCFVEDQGLTFFKKFMEWIIFLFLVFSLVLLKQRSKILPRRVTSLVAGAIALTTVSELCFVFYVDVYGISNSLGHLLKIASFFLLYKATIEKNLVQPRSEMKQTLVEKETKIEAEEAFNRVLAELARKIITAESIEEVSGFVLEKAKKLTESSFGFAGYIDRETGFLVSPTLTRTVWEQCSVQDKDYVFVEFSGLWGWVLENRQALYVNEVGSDPRSTGVPSGHLPIDNFLSVPAVIGEKLVGQIAVANSSRPYQKEDTQALEKIAHLYAIAINETQRINDLEKAKQAAEAANNTKTLFLANMSHEIRTPLNAVSGFAQLLKDAPGTKSNPRQQKYVSHIIEAADRLMTLINDILDVARIEAGEIRTKSEPFSSQGLIDEIKSVVSGLNIDKGLACNVRADETLPENIVGDHDRIMQVLTNFIANAVKFTDKGFVTVSVEHHFDEKILFRVSDTGIGISEEGRKGLFDKFYQVDSSYTKKHQGVGLGLAICKELVELMGGEIGFESEMGKGSTFYFTLDMKTGESDLSENGPSGEKNAPAPAAEENLRILLAEDDDLSRKSITHYLKKAGHRVTEAANGEEVLELLRADDFDIILMDVQMPEMDGVQATKNIRNSTSGPWNPDIPILALTAYTMAGDREEFMDAGMTDYISKPVNFTELNQKINRLMQNRPAAGESPPPADGDHPGRKEDIADVRAFLTSNKDDPEFSGQILKSFPGHVSERMARLKAAVENRDAKETAAAAHKFIALFSAVYIRSAFQTSRDLQTAARQGDLESCQHLFQDLEPRMNEIVQYIESISEKRG